MPETTEWLYWNCRQCGHRHIRGDQKLCPGCGHQIDHDERREMEGTVDDTTRSEEVISDAATLARVAGAGKADWWCNACDKSVPFDQATCDLCGAQRDAAFEDLQQLRTARGVRESRQMKGEDRAVLVERFGPEEGREVLAGRGRSDTRDTPPPPPPRPWRLYAVIALCVLVAGILIARTVVRHQVHDTTGHIAALRWTRTETVETFTPVRRTGWRDELRPAPARLPVNGAGESAGAVIDEATCAQAHFRDEPYVCGHHTERYQVSVRDPDNCFNVSVTKTRRVADGQDCTTTARICKSNKNGSKTCTGGDRVCTTRYKSESYSDTERKCEPRSHMESRTREVNDMCTRPIFKTQCAFDTYEWRQREAKTLNGTGPASQWPGLAVGVLDRVRRAAHDEAEIAWEGDGETRTSVRQISSTELAELSDGAPVSLRVRGTGELVEVLHLGE